MQIIKWLQQKTFKKGEKKSLIAKQLTVYSKFNNY